MLARLGDHAHRFAVVAEAALRVLILVLHIELSVRALLVVANHFGENIALCVRFFFRSRLVLPVLHNEQVDGLSVTRARQVVWVLLVVEC